MVELVETYTSKTNEVPERRRGAKSKYVKTIVTFEHFNI